MNIVMDKTEYSTIAPNRASTYDIPVHNVSSISETTSDAKNIYTDTEISGNFNNSAGKKIVTEYSKLDQNAAGATSPGRVVAMQQLNSNSPHYEMNNDVTAHNTEQLRNIDDSGVESCVTDTTMYSKLDKTSAMLKGPKKLLPKKEQLNSGYPHHETNKGSKKKENPLKTKHCRIKLLCVIVLLLAISLFIAAGSALTVAFLQISQLRSEIDIVQTQSNNTNTDIIMNTDLEKHINEVNNRLENISHHFLSTLEDINQIIAQDTEINKNLAAFLITVLNETGYLFTSCASILKLSPSTPSGYYNIRSSSGSAITAYCDMTRSCGGITGGWMRVYELDMRDDSSQCPDDLELSTSPRRTCRIESEGDDDSYICSSDIFMVNELEYSEVCGKIIAYQVGIPDAFAENFTDINTYYVDGVSLTHGMSPKQHIWTFAAAGNEDNKDPELKCPCINTAISSNISMTAPPPPFVGNNYFCDTAAVTGRDRIFYEEDPLWDGEGCGPQNTCCSFNNPPWFYRELPQSTTDDIEMRVCRDEDRDNEDIVIEVVEIYVR